MIRTSARTFSALFLLIAIAMAVRPVTANNGYSPAPGGGSAANPFKGTFPWLVARCRASDETDGPEPTKYFEQLFTSAGKGTMNMVDYWHDLSYGKLSIDGTTIANGRQNADSRGWYVLPQTKAQYDQLSRSAEVQTCANMASVDYPNLTQYYGIIAVYPEADSGASGGDADGYGPISVTLPGVNGKGGGTFFLSLVNFPSNVNPTFAGHEMGHGFGLHHSRILSKLPAAYLDNYDIMSAMATDSFTPPSNDAHDVTYGGSLLNSLPAAKGPGADAITLDDEGWIPRDWRFGPLSGGPWQGSVHLHSLSDPNATTDSTGGAVGSDAELMELQLSANVTFPWSSKSSTPPNPTCTSSNYTLEYREATRWDAGIPAPASYWNPTSADMLGEGSSPDFPIGSIVLHLLCISSWDTPPAVYSYSILTDEEPPGGGHRYQHNPNLYSQGVDGAFFPGDEYADKANRVYFAVNAMDTAKHEATVSFVLASNSAIKDELKLRAIPSAVPSGQAFTVKALLSTDNHGNENNPSLFGFNSVVPGHRVDFRFGASRCSAVTDLDGSASCDLTAASVVVDKTETLTVTTDATRAYRSATASKGVTIASSLHRITVKLLERKRTAVPFVRPAPPIRPNAGGV